MTAVGAGVGAFRESWLQMGGTAYARARDVESWEARSLRYAYYRAMRENTVYSDINGWASAFRATHGLYKALRGCYNPAARIVDFHVSHILGGPLDPLAGDGAAVPTSCPVVGVEESDRPAIARLFADSRWASKKNLWVQQGACCGDAILKLRDDADRMRVMIEPIDPGTLYHVERAADGATLGYTQVEDREDPRPGREGRYVEYREDCAIDPRSGVVSWWTYLDGKPYPWNGVESSWSAPVGFVPLWTVQHIDVGLLWGESELSIGRAKVHEVNDVASKLHDQIRQMVEGAHAITGAKKPRERVRFQDSDSETDTDVDERQTGKVLWIPNENAAVHSMVHDLDIAGVSQEIRQNLDNLEDDYPELRFERLRTGGTISGEALRIARQPAGMRVQSRRPAYDAALGRAIRGALAYAGWAGYPGYEAYGVDDYRDGRLATLAIGDRPVFEVDEQDRTNQEKNRFETLLMAKQSGVPIGIAMRRLGGFTDADIAAAERRDERMLAAELKPSATVTTAQPEKNASY